MTRPRLGKNQLARLCALGRPSAWQIVPCPETRALVAKGYMRHHHESGDGFIGISPAGLRRLADELEAGNLARLMPTKATITRRKA